MNQTQVIVAGAGPTGMVLALWLARAGVRVRIVDPVMAPGQASRAMAVHARTLEFYDQLGLGGRVVGAGIVADHFALRSGGREVGRVPLNKAGETISPHPYILAYPQDDHERLLQQALLEAGVTIERGVQVIGFEQLADGVRVRLDSPQGEDKVDVDYLCGCDGAGSRVRHVLGVDFRGGTYDQTFFVADALVTGAAADGGVQLCTSEEDFCLVMPVRRTGSYRLIGIVQEAPAGAALVFDDVAARVRRTTGLVVDAVNWFSTYRVHHRMASAFARGHVFLAGDAAHVHSPAGGQGMNTGIGDAVNLAWKLAAVLHRRALPSILETYATERMAFARRLLRSTDRAFRIMANPGPVGRVWRQRLLPPLAARVMRMAFVPKAVFRLVSQVRLAYPQSTLSHGRAGKLRGGDRLPWVVVGAEDNFDSLASRDWQIHVYGEPGSGLRRLAYNTGLPMHSFAWSDAARDAGLAAEAVYLVRPDGYIAYALSRQGDDGLLALANFVARHGIVAAPEAVGRHPTTAKPG
jgi:2-polyprenyl-6-methoxyphenol hydroxylase-like FAD-dependent oxidoreductase